MINCKICNKEFETPGKLQLHITSKHFEVDKEEYYKLYINNIPGNCKFCGNKAVFKGFTAGYLNNCSDKECVKKAQSPFSKEYKIKVDGLTEDEYEKWSIQDRIEKRKNTEEGFKKKRVNDPDFDKKNSKYCKEFWINKGYSEKEAIELALSESKKNRDKFQNKLKDDPDYMKGKSWVSKDYWINKGFTEEESINIVSQKQKTFSRDICIEKYGEEEGIKRWTERQYTWSKNYKKSNYSKISQKLFWSLYPLLDVNDQNNTYFATKGTENNNEYTLKCEGFVLKPDFIILNKNKIIEFDGDYWHDYNKRNKPMNKSREEKRDALLESSGFQILRIFEKDYKIYTEQTINKCLKFLGYDRTEG